MLSIGLSAETRFGDIDRATAESPVTIDQIHDTLYQGRPGRNAPREKTALGATRGVVRGHTA